MRHWVESAFNPNDPHCPKRHAANKAEVGSFIGKAQLAEKARGMGEVYMTDHTPKQQRYHTANAAEDTDFFKYKQSVAEFNAMTTTTENPTDAPVVYDGRYKRGSLAQRMFDPLATAQRLSNGSLFIEVTDAELKGHIWNDENTRKVYERLNDQSELEFGEDEAADARIALFAEFDAANADNADELNDMLAKELNIFQDGEDYNFVKDLRHGFDDGLRVSAADKIFATIPDHVFWDIKKPLQEDPETAENPYHPGRAVPYTDFFDMRRHEQYHIRQREKRNITENISFHKLY